MKEPFFIVGCPRSGTTMLRDVLRMHPALDSPEETHFYRWCQPFKGTAYTRTYSRNPDILKHRELDGITNDEFDAMWEKAGSRKDLQEAYMSLFLERSDKSADRWFDKTPQNAYGINMLRYDYPGSKFIHIYRNPLNVVASMKKGVIIKQEDIIASISYWMECVSSLQVLQDAYPDSVIAIRYEKLLTEPEKHLRAIIEFVDETWDPALVDYNFGPATDNYPDLLTEAEQAQVSERCQELLDTMDQLAV